MLLLNIVTDEKLLTSQIIKIVLLCLVGLGIVFNLINIIRTKTTVRRLINAVLLLALSVFAFFVFKEYRLESSLLNNAKYVEGITLGYCDVTGLGEGIEYEYQVDGKVYKGCNTYHPIPKDSIIVPGGRYMVRYSEHYIEKGRMDFAIQAP